MVPKKYNDNVMSAETSGHATYHDAPGAIYATFRDGSELRHQW